MKRAIRPVAAHLSSKLIAACLALALTSAAAAEGRSSRRPTASATLQLPAAANEAIRRVHDLHRAAPPNELGLEERRLHQLERATRRIQLLLLDAAKQEEPAAPAEALSTLRAEWARWKQLRRDAGSDRQAARGGPPENQRERVAERLDALARTIAREMSAAEVAATGASAEARKSARDQQRARLERKPSKLAERFPPSMLAVLVSGEAADEAALAETAPGHPVAREGLEQALADAAEQQRLIHWPELKQLLGGETSSESPSAPGDDRGRRSFISPDGGPGSMGRDRRAPREVAEEAP